VSAALALVVAHQGGWDELLFVLVPIAVFAFLLRMANRRASQLDADGEDAPPGADRDGGGGDPDRPGPPGLW